MDEWPKVEDKEVVYITSIWWDVCTLSIKYSHIIIMGKGIWIWTWKNWLLLCLSSSIWPQSKLPVDTKESEKVFVKLDLVWWCYYYFWIVNNCCTNTTMPLYPHQNFSASLIPSFNTYTHAHTHTSPLLWQVETVIIDFLFSLLASVHSLQRLPTYLALTEQCCSRRALKDRLDCLGILISHFFILLSLCVSFLLHIPTPLILFSHLYHLHLQQFASSSLLLTGE